MNPVFLAHLLPMPTIFLAYGQTDFGEILKAFE
jgi:hypothetical protein